MDTNANLRQGPGDEGQNSAGLVIDTHAPFHNKFELFCPSRLTFRFK